MRIGGGVAALVYLLGGATALLLAAALLSRSRSARLLVCTQAATTSVLGGQRPLAEVLWEYQLAGALSQVQLQRLIQAKSQADALEVLSRADSVQRELQELAVLVARARHISQAAHLVTQGAGAAAPAVDALLSQVGGLAGLLPGAAVGVANAQAALSLLGVHVDALHAGAGAVDHLAGHLLDGHLPVFTIARVAHGELQKVSAGKPVSAALQHATLDVAGGAGGSFAGVHAGAVAGTLLLPGLGTALGAALGAVAGGLAGRRAALAVKVRPLLAANDELAAAALAALPASIGSVRGHLADIALPACERTHRAEAAWAAASPTGVRATWWPSYGQALHTVSRRAAARDECMARALHAGVSRAVTAAGRTCLGEAGTAILLLSCPVEAAALGVDPQAVARLVPLQQRAAALRKGLAR